MVAEISIWGSCSSRNIFNSDINENYKDFFCIKTVIFISLMSTLINYEKLLFNSDLEFDNVLNCLCSVFKYKYNRIYSKK